MGVFMWDCCLSTLNHLDIANGFPNTAYKSLDDFSNTAVNVFWGSIQVLLKLLHQQM